MRPNMPGPEAPGRVSQGDKTSAAINRASQKLKLFIADKRNPASAACGDDLIASNTLTHSSSRADQPKNL
jgi:hypothetical protein